MTRKSSNQNPGLLKTIKPLNITQNEYIKSIHNNVITIGSGCSGTGKTMCAIALACEYLVNGKISNILVSRPIIAAGEEIGALPGELSEKIQPYMLPAYEYFKEFLGHVATQKLLKEDIIQFIPTELLRGATFNDCFMVLDEAQNCNIAQIKLFLTRIGNNSKIVINGDISQADISDSGLRFVINRLRHKIKDVKIIDFSYEDVVRHGIIAEILKILDFAN